MRLSELGPRQMAVIRALHCSPEVRGRLMDLGLLPGCPVELVRLLPLSHGLQLAVRRSRLVMRRELAALIDVEVVAHA